MSKASKRAENFTRIIKTFLPHLIERAPDSATTPGLLYAGFLVTLYYRPLIRLIRYSVAICLYDILINVNRGGTLRWLSWLTLGIIIGCACASSAARRNGRKPGEQDWEYDIQYRYTHIYRSVDATMKRPQGLHISRWYLFTNFSQKKVLFPFGLLISPCPTRLLWMLTRWGQASHI